MSWVQHVVSRVSALRSAGARCFGSVAHGFVLQPPISTEALTTLCASVELPDDYVAFLEQVATHGAGPGYGLVPPVNVCGWERPFLASHDWAPNMADPAERAVVEGLGGDYYSDFWTHGCLPLADWGCGIVSLLLVNAPEPVRGRVFIDVRWAGMGIRQTHASFREFYESWLDLVERGEPGVNVPMPQGTCANWNALDNFLAGKPGPEALREIPEGGIVQAMDEDCAYYSNGDSLRSCPACSARIQGYIDGGCMRPGQVAPGRDLRSVQMWTLRASAGSE